MTLTEVNIELDRLLSFRCVMLLSDIPHRPAAFERLIFKSAVILPLPPSASPFLWQSQLKPEAYAASLSLSSARSRSPSPSLSLSLPLSLNLPGSLFSLFVEAEGSVHSPMTGSMHVGGSEEREKPWSVSRAERWLGPWLYPFTARLQLAAVL